MLANIISNFGGYTGYNMVAYNMISGLRRELAHEGKVLEKEIALIADQNSSSKDPLLTSNIQKTNIFALADKTLALYPFSRMMDFHGKYRIGFPMYEGSKLSNSDIAFLNTLDHIVSPCSHLTNLYKSSVKTPVTEILVGIDTDIYRVLKSKQEDPNRPFVYLMVGKFETRKASLESLLAFLQTFENHPERENVVLKLKWLTQGYSRNMNEIRGATNHLLKMYPRAAKRIVMLDNPREDLVRLYNEADCFLFPSKAEGIGLPLIEAMACGVPCITTAYTSLSDYANNKVAIVLPDRGQVPMQDQFYGISSENWGTYGRVEVDDISEAMLKILAMPKKERIELGLNARSFVELNFTTRHFGKRLLNFLRSI